MNEKLHKALGIFLEAMRPFVVGVLQRNFPSEQWEGVFFARLSPDKQRTWNQGVAQLRETGGSTIGLIDYNNLNSFALSFKEQLQREVGNRDNVNSFINCLGELKTVRNTCQHFQPVDADDEERAFSNMKRVARMLEMGELYDEIDSIVRVQPRPAVVSQPVAETAQTTSFVDNVAFVDNDGPLVAWFNNVKPQFDIRNNVLDESIFAANLGEVANGTGPEVYSNYALFFEKTFITDGLRDIANRVVKALNGEESENRVISLQTGFGGGKTHSLISLFHIVKNAARIADLEACQGLFHNGVRPNFDAARVAVFTNNTVDVAQGHAIESDGIIINTLWGEIAYQLGGIEAYRKIEENDKQRIAPTAPLLKEILANSVPSLILIDELADYCSKANSKRVGASTLYNQTLSFIQTLTETVATTPKCVLIATLPASATEVATSAIGQEILDSLHHRVVRVGTNIKPVDDEEIFEVVRRRLFEYVIDESAIDAVANKYKKMYYDRRTDLPDNVGTAFYANKIKKSYPFHPELIDMFRLRWGSDHRFQRTRGVLRLLASIVQDLWRRRANLAGSQALIHSSDLMLENLSTITGTITNLMGSNWESVMHADVMGTSSNSYKIDNEEPGSRMSQYHLTQGIATTLLMSSIGTHNKGLTIKELKLCVLRPSSFNHNDVNGALSKLEQVAHYLYASNMGERKFWFESKANINILINQAKNEITPAERNVEIINRLNSACSGINKVKVLVNPSNDVPEQKLLTMVIFSPDVAIPNDNSVSSSIKRKVEEIALKKGSSDRIYRNTIFYLACSEMGRAELFTKLQDYLACVKIENEYSSQLERDQKDEIAARKRIATREVDNALLHAFNKVLKHQAMGGIEVYELKEYASDFATQINSNLIKELQDEEWLLSRIGRNILNKNNLLPTEDNPIKVVDIYNAFLRFDDKPMIVGASAVSETMIKFCVDGFYNVGVKDGSNYSRIYVREQIPFFDVTDESYWLLDKNVLPAPTPAPGMPVPNPGTPTPTPGRETPEENPVPSPTSVTYQSVTISGRVPMENWSQIFSSFIQTMRNNNLQIEVKIKAKNNPMNPLTDNSAIIKSVKESASQLGLTFETEE